MATMHGQPMTYANVDLVLLVRIHGCGVGSVVLKKERGVSWVQVL